MKLSDVKSVAILVQIGDNTYNLLIHKDHAGILLRMVDQLEGGLKILDKPLEVKWNNGEENE